MCPGEKNTYFQPPHLCPPSLSIVDLWGKPGGPTWTTTIAFTVSLVVVGIPSALLLAGGGGHLYICKPKENRSAIRWIYSLLIPAVAVKDIETVILIEKSYSIAGSVRSYNNKGTICSVKAWWSASIRVKFMLSILLILLSKVPANFFADPSVNASRWKCL